MIRRAEAKLSRKCTSAAMSISDLRRSEGRKSFSGGTARLPTVAAAGGKFAVLLHERSSAHALHARHRSAADKPDDAAGRIATLLFATVQKHNRCSAQRSCSTYGRLDLAERARPHPPRCSAFAPQRLLSTAPTTTSDAFATRAARANMRYCRRHSAESCDAGTMEDARGAVGLAGGAAARRAARGGDRDQPARPIPRAHAARLRAARTALGARLAACRRD